VLLIFLERQLDDQTESFHIERTAGISVGGFALRRRSTDLGIALR
jgi:hypothetical protein